MTQSNYPGFFDKIRLKMRVKSYKKFEIGYKDFDTLLNFLARFRLDSIYTGTTKSNLVVLDL